MHLLFLRSSFVVALMLSLCSLSAQDGFVDYFQDGTNSINPNNAAGRITTFTVDTECESVILAITDTMNDPLPRFNAFEVNPTNAAGDDITDITGNVNVTMRVRSLEAVNVSVLLRSGDGTTDNRSGRLDFDVPAGLEDWTEFTLTFTEADLAGFDAADLRDVWFYLDRGTENFAGNEFHLDHIAVATAPDAAQNSPCPITGGGAQSFVDYFQDGTSSINPNNSAGRVTTFMVDTECEAVVLSVTDTTNEPLPSFNAYEINPVDAAGDDITDITGNVNVTMRVRSAEAVNVSVLLRSGDGTTDNRSGRLDFDVPAGLDDWTEFTLTFTEADLEGFDAADLRDVWFFLDRGTENFAGNEFHLDHIAIATAPDAAQNSPCPITGDGAQSFVDYFQDGTSAINPNNSAGRVTTFTVDTECEAVVLSVTDTTNEPLPSFNAYEVNPVDAAGDDITDITGNVNVTMRVRSLEAVNVSVLLRSGDGTTDNRSDRLDFDVPAGLDDWTEFTLTFTEADLAGFDATDLRDAWFFLDRGTENFAGNEFHLDHIAIATAPDAAQNSPCPIDDSGVAGVFVDYFQADSLTSFTTNNSAGRVSTFIVDTECETVTISATDPVNEPVPPFNAYQVNPTNEAGEDITDITGNLNVTMRVRSAEAVNVSILLRSGGGTMEERTERLAVDIPGGLEEWTEFTVAFTAADLAGFTPTDLLDIWFYLDRGEANFSGNLFIVDHIAVGTQPDAAQNSPCSLVSAPTEFVAQFTDSTSVNVLGGSEADRLTLSANTCEEVSIAVTDPAGAPFGAFRPIVIFPTDATGTPITNIEGETDVFIRIRSAEEFPVSVLFRSGDGSTDFRTAVVSRMVAGDLTGWSNLEFSFSEADLGGFDPTDLVDMWLFLDRDNDNFPGNEVYIDYIAIGSRPDSTANSPCGLPDLISSTRQALWAGNVSLYPNPTSGMVTVEIPQLAGSANPVESRLIDVTGRTVLNPLSVVVGGRMELDLHRLPPGIYFLQLTDANGGRALQRIVKR